MNKKFKREITWNSINFVYKKHKYSISVEDFKKYFGSFNVIKLRKEEFTTLPKKKKIYSHFNLQQNGHKEGMVYFLIPIETLGSFDGKKQIQPVLNFDSIISSTCLTVENNISFTRISKKHYKNAPLISSGSELKKWVLGKYLKTLPNSSEKELLSLGFSRTDLEIGERVDVSKVLGDFFLKEKQELIKKNSKSSGSIRNGAVKLKVFGTGFIRSGFGKGLLEAREKNKNVVALTADLRDSLKLGDFSKKYPNDFYEMGICEQHMASAAAGMSLGGKVPFIVSYAAFSPGRNFDQIRVSIAYSQHNVKIVGGHAGLTTGPDGATHQMLEDIAMMRALPNMTVVVPCDELEAKKATLALAQMHGPAYLRLSRETSKLVTKPASKFILGKINVLKKGDDVTLAACGITVQFVLEAAKKLEKIGVSCEVLNVHTIKPFDKKTFLASVRKTKCVVSVEEHQILGGLGSRISECLTKSFPVPQEFVGVENSFGESGEGYELLEKYGISTKEIVKKVKKVISRRE